jgi:putative acetyltransferase
MEVYRASIHALAAGFYNPEQLKAWAPAEPNADRWRERLAQARTLVMEHDAAIAGFVAYDLKGHVDLLYTHPNFARRGIATRLCAAVERELRAAGVSRIFTEASLAARPFFEHRGFQVITEETVACRGQQLRRYAMEKRT